MTRVLPPPSGPSRTTRFSSLRAFAAVLSLACWAPAAFAQPRGEERLRHEWRRLRFSEPPQRTPFSEGVGVYDPFHRQFIVHEGSPTDVAALSTDDGLWRKALLSPVGPATRAGHAAVFHVDRRAMLIFGGSGGFEGRLNDVWALDTRRRAWSRLDDPADPNRPEVRSNTSLVLDTNRDRLLVFGGITGRGLSPEVLGDLFEFDLRSGSWREIVPPTGPTPRARLGHAAVFDAHRDRMIVYGGQHYSDRVAENLSDLWAFDCATETWAQLPSTGPDAPPALLDGTFVTDGRHRAVLLGGHAGTLPLLFYRGVRILDLRTDTWLDITEPIDGDSTPPGGGGGPGLPPREEFTTFPPIAHHVAAYVPGDVLHVRPKDRLGRVFVFGGQVQKRDLSVEYRVDTWIYERPNRIFFR